MKSFVQKDGNSLPPENGNRNPTVEFKDEKGVQRQNESITDPETRLYKKRLGQNSYELSGPCVYRETQCPNLDLI